MFVHSRLLVMSSNFTNNVQNIQGGDTNISLDFLESNEKLASSNLENISIEMMGDRITNNNMVGDGGDQIINLNLDNNQSDPIFSGKTARPVFVSVGTKFASIPKFESASALRTWGAFV